MGPYFDDPIAGSIQVNVPRGTTGDIINDILGNLPNLTSAFADIFGIIRPQQQQQQQQPMNLTPLYLMAGLALIITLTKK
jgi:hypothetical protein